MNNTWRRVLTLSFTSLAILSMTASCNFLGINFGGNESSTLGVLKRDPAIKQEGFGRVNATTRYDGAIDSTGLADDQVIKMEQIDNDTIVILSPRGFHITNNGGRDWKEIYIHDLNTDDDNLFNTNLQKNYDFRYFDFEFGASEAIIYITGQEANLGVVYKSTNSGKTFEKIFSDVYPATLVRKISVDPRESSRVFLSLGNDVIFSENSGDTWSKIYTTTNQIIQSKFLNDGRLMLLDSDSTLHMRETGQEFTNFVPNGYSNGNSLINVIEVVENTGSTYIFFSTKDVRSSNTLDGDTTLLNLPIDSNTFRVDAFTSDPKVGLNRLLIVVNNRILESNDRGLTWSINKDLEVSFDQVSVSSILIDQNNTDVIYLGLGELNTQSNRGFGLFGDDFTLNPRIDYQGEYFDINSPVPTSFSIVSN